MGSLLFLGAASAASASNIQFDIQGSGAPQYNSYPSPAYFAGDITTADTSWNPVSADVTSGLSYSNGTAATGVAIDLGAYIVSNSDRSTAVPYNDPNGVQDWNYSPSGGYSYTALDAYAQNDLAQDLLYVTPSTGSSLAARINGLAAGTYHVYLISMIDESGAGANTRVYNDYIGVNLSGTFGNTPISVGPALGAPDWVAGSNYAFATVTISGPGDYITLISTQGSQPAVINGVQIVSVVPEPASLGLGLLGAAAIIRRRRAR
jgi:hypothetical protein